MYTVIAHWYVQENNRAAALRALKALADKVKDDGDIWGYLIHTGADQSLPPASSNEIVFIEIYKDKRAFLNHLKSDAYTQFVEKHGGLFVQNPPKGNPYQPFFLAKHVNRHAGFVRPQAC